MTSINARINGQADYHRPAAQTQAAWREEMLDQLLGQMRDRRLPEAPPAAESLRAAVPGKGSYVDLYV